LNRPHCILWVDEALISLNGKPQATYKSDQWLEYSDIKLTAPEQKRI